MQGTEQVPANFNPVIIYVGYGIMLAFIAFDKAGYWYQKRRGKNGNGNGQQLLTIEDMATALAKAIDFHAKTNGAEFMKKDDCGRQETCIEHEGRLIKIETDLPNIKRAVDETKKAVDAHTAKTSKNFRELFSLLRKQGIHGNGT